MGYTGGVGCEIGVQSAEFSGSPWGPKFPDS